MSRKKVAVAPTLKIAHENSVELVPKPSTRLNQIGKIKNTDT